MSLIYYFLLEGVAGNYQIILDEFESSNIYFLLFLSGFAIPLILWAIFYFILRYPYANIIHWIFAYLLITIIVFGFSYSSVNTTIWGSLNPDFNNLLASEPDAEKVANSLPTVLGLLNVFYSLISSFCYCLVFKRFSKIQMHLPF